MASSAGNVGIIKIAVMFMANWEHQGSKVSEPVCRPMRRQNKFHLRYVYGTKDAKWLKLDFER